MLNKNSENPIPIVWATFTFSFACNILTRLMALYWEKTDAQSPFVWWSSSNYWAPIKTKLQQFLICGWNNDQSARGMSAERRWESSSYPGSSCSSRCWNFCERSPIIVARETHDLNNKLQHKQLEICLNNLNLFLETMRYCCNNFLIIKWIITDKILFKYNETVTKSTGYSKHHSCGDENIENNLGWFC